MTTLHPSRGDGRRGPLRSVVAVVLALAVGLGAGWYLGGRDKATTATAPSSTPSCQRTSASSTSHTPSPTGTRRPTASGAAHATAKPVTLPAPNTITVNVYNATTRRGLARTTSLEMSSRGFTVGQVANDPLNRVIPAPAEVRYGPRGVLAARVVAAQVPDPRMVRDARKNATVDLVLGEGFTALNTPAQAQAQLIASPTPTPSC
jgi:LytR cell envelope-related transcriptional attenuator